MNKTSLNHLQIHTFTFKNVIFTTAKYEMYLRILHKLCFPGCIFSKQAKPGTKQGWILRRTISHRKVLLCPQKENWAFFWTFPFLQRWILNLEQRETLALVKKFDIGLSFGDGVHRELNRHVTNTVDNMFHLQSMPGRVLHPPLWNAFTSGFHRQNSNYSSDKYLWIRV